MSADRQAALEAGKCSAALAATIAIGKLHGFAFDPIKEGGSIPRGQIAPPEPTPPPVDENRAEKIVYLNKLAHVRRQRP